MIATMEPTDADIRLAVYETALESGEVLTPLEVSERFGCTPLEATETFQRLQDDHDALVLLPGSGYIWMAEPFSAVPTDFPVVAGSRRWYGNCVWDAAAIAVLVGGRSEMPTACPSSGRALVLRADDGRLVAGPGVVHFAVPPSLWWESIGFT